MQHLVKSKEDIEILREAGRRLAVVRDATAEMIKPGITTAEIDEFAENMMIEFGDKPAFKNYQPEGAHRPFPATVCVSVNEEI